MVPPKIRPLGESVCKFSENSDVIYWVKYVKISIMTSLEVTGGQIEVPLNGVRPTRGGKIDH